jgi:hypothetical protein
MRKKQNEPKGKREGERYIKVLLFIAMQTWAASIRLVQAFRIRNSVSCRISDSQARLQPRALNVTLASIIRCIVGKRTTSQGGNTTVLMPVQQRGRIVIRHDPKSPLPRLIKRNAGTPPTGGIMSVMPVIPTRAISMSTSIQKLSRWPRIITMRNVLYDVNGSHALA